MKKTKKQMFFKAVSICWIISTVFIDLIPRGASAAFSMPSFSMPTFSLDDGLDFNGSDSTAMSFFSGIPDSQKMFDLTESLTESDIGVTATKDSRKAEGPKLNVHLSSNGEVKGGAIIEATAIPSGFTNLNNPLYYTWYLKHDNCKPSGSLNDNNRRCDLDGDGKVTINDWKIEATRIMLDGTYNSSDANYTNYSNDIRDASGAVAIPSTTSEWITNFKRTDDGSLYENNGDSSSVPFCYIQDFKTGIIYELRGGGDEQFDSCTAGYHRACVDNSNQSCETVNPLYSAADDTANQQAINDAIANNETPPARYNVPKTIKWDTQTCSATGGATMACDGGGTINYSAEAGCSGSARALCVQDSDVTTFKPLSGSGEYGRIWNSPICTKANADSFGITGIPGDTSGTTIDNTWKNGFTYGTQSNNTTIIDTNCSTLVDNVKGGAWNMTGNSLTPTCSRGGGGNNSCTHLFAKYPKTSVTVDGRTLDMTNEITGDGKFSATEKAFWKADPTRSSTAGKASDEAVVMGVNMDTFAWAYASGDEIGVVVGGESSLVTDHIDGSKRRMWAFSKNACSKLENIPSGNVSYYTETTDEYETTINVAEFNVEDCLEENLIDPVQKVASKMTVSLSSSKDPVINNVNGEGDLVTISASVKNVTNSQNLFYNWQIEKSQDGSTTPTSSTSWKNITTDMQDNASFTADDQKGFGKKKIKINLNLSDAIINSGGMDLPMDKGYFYLRIRAKVGEKEGDESQNSDGIITIKVYDQKNSMNAFAADADTDGQLTINRGVKICNDPTGKACGISGVTQNEIIALEIPNVDNSNILGDFTWKVNGKYATCEPSYSPQCVLGGNLLFFPAVGKVGETITIEAAAINKSTNDHVVIVRNFKIISPDVKIISSDTDAVWPKLKGYFNNLDGTRSEDFSTTNFQTLVGNTVSLQAVFNPSWKEAQSDYSWKVDGVDFGTLGSPNTATITFPANKLEGENYQINLNVIYKPGANTQVNNLRKALLNDWGIAQNESIEQTDTANMQIDVVPASAVAMNKSSFPWAANLLSHIPEQVLFSLRILLTGFVLLFVTSLVFSLMPEMEEKRY